jgi:hypothetical protein
MTMVCIALVWYALQENGMHCIGMVCIGKWYALHGMVCIATDGMVWYVMVWYGMHWMVCYGMVCIVNGNRNGIDWQ